MCNSARSLSFSGSLNPIGVGVFVGDGKPSRPGQMGAMRLAGAGVELVATVVVACLLGYWIDRRFGTEPWGLLILAGVGIVGGIYNLVRQAVHEMFRRPGEIPPTTGSGKQGNPSDKS